VNDGASVDRLNIQRSFLFDFGRLELITRTIVPLIDQQGFPSNAMNESGLGDVVASQFFSPKAPTANGWIWGAGPVELLPTASDEALGAEKWGLGPTAVALNRSDRGRSAVLPITSVRGRRRRPGRHQRDLCAALRQLRHETKTTFGVMSESTYD